MIKNHIIFLILLIISTNYAFCQRQEITYTYDDFYVDSLNIWQNMKTPATEIKYFDKNDNLIKIINSTGIGDFSKKINETDFEYDDNKNKIKEETYAIGYLDNPFKILKEWKYVAGNLVDERLSYYNFEKEKFELNYIYKNTYNSKNQKILAEFIYYSYEGPELKLVENHASTNYTYDSFGNLILQQMNYTNSYPITYQNLYNSNNQIIESKFFAYISSDNTIYSKTTFEYDLNGNLVTVKNFDGKNESYYGQKYSFDDKNREILKVFNGYDAEKKVFNEVQREITIYNDKGQIAKYIIQTKFNSGIDAFEIGNNLSVRENTYIYNSENKLKQKDAILYVLENNIKTFHTPERERFEYETLINKPEKYTFSDYIVYPNPATNTIIVDNTLNNQCLNLITLNAINGQKIAEFRKENIAKCRWELDIPKELPKGLYLLYFIAFDGTITSKKVMIN